MSWIDAIEEILPEGWEIHDPQMGSDFMLDCPHGYTIEQDGTCPEGCESPLRTAGLI